MKPGSKALTELTGTEEKPQQGALVYYLCKAGPNVATERISLRMKIRKVLMFMKQSKPQRTCITLTSFSTSVFAFSLSAKEFKFYTIIFSFPPHSALFLYSSPDGFWQRAFSLF